MQLSVKTLSDGHSYSSNRIGTCLKIELSLVTRANWSDSCQPAHLTGNTCFFFQRQKPSLFTWSGAEQSRALQESIHCSSRASGGIIERPASSLVARPLQIPMPEITTQRNETWLVQSWSCLLQILIHLQEFLQHFPSAPFPHHALIFTRYQIFSASLLGSVFALMCVVTVVHSQDAR